MFENYDNIFKNLQKEVVVNILLQSEFLWKLIAIVLQMRDEIHRTILLTFASDYMQR